MTSPDQKQTAHTAGPWTAHLNFRGRDGSPDVWQIDDEHDAVCTTQFCYAQNTEANARLIAAAPDLLAVAIKSHEPYEGLADQEVIDLYGGPEAELCFALRAAISRATGSSSQSGGE